MCSDRPISKVIDSSALNDYSNDMLRYKFYDS